MQIVPQLILKIATTMKNTSGSTPAAPVESDIRDYAYHLYCQNGRVPGRDLDDWLEAEACLLAEIPRKHSHRRMHQYLHGRGYVGAASPVAA